MNYIFISPNYPSGHWKYIAALRAAGCSVLGIGDAGDETFPAELRGSMTEYYRVGNLHNYDEVYRAVAYFISRRGRPDFIESLNPYWVDLVDALRNDFMCGSFDDADICGSFYNEAALAYLDYSGRLLPERVLFSTTDEALAFAEKCGYPLLAVPVRNKRLGKRLIAAEAGLRLLLRGEEAGSWIFSALHSGEQVSVDGLFVFDEAGSPLPLAVAAHMLNADSSVYSLPLDPSTAQNAAELAGLFCREGFFHIDAVKLAKAVPGVGKKGDIVFNGVDAAPPHEFLIECLNIEFGTDLRRLWAELAAGDEAAAEKGEEAAAAAPAPLEQKCFAGIASRSFGRSYKNPHEKILRRLTIKLACHGLTSEPDKFRFGDYYYIFSGEAAAELKRTIKFITEDFDKCQ